MNHFRIGGKVVCVINAPWIEIGGRVQPCALPISGHIYTVREIVPEDAMLWLGFEEIPVTADGNPVFDSRRFKPVIERSTDISALTELLNPLNHKPLPEVTPLKERVDIGA